MRTLFPFRTCAPAVPSHPTLARRATVAPCAAGFGFGSKKDKRAAGGPSKDAACPCGSGAAYTDCCGVYHRGVPAPTPEALMRSRLAYILL
jgi:uncharacterized protein YecA (UPF0149 family)